MNARDLLLLSTIVFAGCGSMAPCDDGGTHLLVHDAGSQPNTCEAAGRTCDSVFGNFTLNVVPPAGCVATFLGLPLTMTFGAFDGGRGQVSLNSSSVTATRQGCSTVVPSLFNTPLELEYEPRCQTLSGTIIGCCRYTDGGPGNCPVTATKP